MWIMYVIGFLVLFSCLYLFLVFPAKKNRIDFTPFHSQIIAHRGMFSEKEHIPENTMLAFRRAVEHGYGIEMDVHITKDNQLVICHDSNLKRVFGTDLIIEDHDYADFSQISAIGCDEKIPLFTDFLQMVHGQVPLIIELKGNAKEARMVPFVKEALSTYVGPFCIETFNPIILRRVRKEMPEVTRGILASHSFSDEPFSPALFAASRLLYNAANRPDFIAYEFSGGNTFTLKFVCHCLGAHPVAWTIRKEEDVVFSKSIFETLICENIPQLFPDGNNTF